VGRTRLVRTFVQCASCRFSALYFIPFCGGLAAADDVRVAPLLLAAAFWIVLTLAIETTNRLADRVEDAINRPERTQLCERVGWPRLARLQAVLWGAVGAAAAAWLALAPGWLLAGLIGLGVCAGIGYSRGPRLARHRLLVFVMLSGTFVGPFSLGWVAGSPGAGIADFSRLGQFTSLFWVATLFITSLAGIKDITDRRGDEAIGYRSAFLALVDRHSTAALAFVAALPYVALAGFVAAGSLPARMLVLVAVLPVSIALGLAVRGAGTSAGEQLAVREALYLHWLAFTSAAVLARYPSVPLLAAIAAAWAWWVLASRSLHWSAPLRLADLRAVAAAARAGAGGPGRAPSPTSSPREGQAWATN
jgi:4-hydroxybenzoate polyprenyltransferase